MNAITPLQRWTRDDWTIPCVLQDAAGNPIDLTGSILLGELWLPGYRVPQALTAANGGIVRVADTQGKFTVVASRLFTALAPGGLALADLDQATRILIAKIDTNGKRQTLGNVFFDVFDSTDTRTIDQIPTVALVAQSTTLQLVVAASQGAPGPSSIAAAQITDGSDVGRSVVTATNASAARAALKAAAIGRSAVSDTNYAALTSDCYVGVASLTAQRTITLPPAANYPQGQVLFIADESGACGTDKPIVIAAAGQDTIGGQSNVSMQSPFMKLAFHSNGSNLWTV